MPSRSTSELVTCVERTPKPTDSANVIVAAPDEVPDDLVIDRIWSNPPIRIGKHALHDLLLRWLAHLGPSGTAHLVVQKHLGADSLTRWLESQGYSTDRRASRKAFRIIDVAPTSTNSPPNNSPTSDPKTEPS